MSVKTQPFIIYILPLGYMFRLSRAIFRPYKEQTQGYLSLSCTIHLDNLGSVLCRAWRWLERAETCSPEVVYIYIINGCVLTDILYAYIVDKHIGMTNIKLLHITQSKKKKYFSNISYYTLFSDPDESVVKPAPVNEVSIAFVQGGSNMTWTDLCVNKLHCAAAVRPWEF